MAKIFGSRTTLAILLAAGATVGVAHARGAEIGTHIYSPSPMLAGHSFRLEMALSPHAMKIIDTDMTSNAGTAGHALSCRMTPAPHHRGMVMLTCSPG